MRNAMTKTIALVVVLAAVGACQRRGPFSDLERRTGKTRCNLDRLNEQEIRSDKPPVMDVTQLKPWVLSGWAIDAVANQPALGVLAVIDGRQTVVAKYGTARPDVASALAQPAFAQTGFEAHLERLDLAPGMHNVTLAIIAVDGRGYFRPDSEWTIEVR
jgi:hypothetical protein